MRSYRVSSELQTVVQSCYDLAKNEGIPTRDAALRIVGEMRTGKLLRTMASEYLVLFLARDERARGLQVERSSEFNTSMAETTRGGVAQFVPPRRGTRAYRKWVDSTDEGKAHQAAREEWEREEAEMRSRHWASMQRALEEYTDQVKIQWTEELLATKFRLRDGSEVTWGDATIEQHEHRRQIFLNNAHSNLEGAARHEHAIRDLKATGVATLAELTVAA